MENYHKAKMFQNKVLIFGQRSTNIICRSRKVFDKLTHKLPLSICNRILQIFHKYSNNSHSFLNILNTSRKLSKFCSPTEQTKRHMFAALQHTLTKLLLKATYSTGVVDTAVDAVHAMAVAAKVMGLDGLAAAIHAVIVEAEGVVVGRYAAAPDSLLSLPRIIDLSGFSVLVDNNDGLRSIIDLNMLITLIYLNLVVRIRWVYIEVSITVIVYHLILLILMLLNIRVLLICSLYWRIHNLVKINIICSNAFLKLREIHLSLHGLNIWWDIVGILLQMLNTPRIVLVFITRHWKLLLLEIPIKRIGLIQKEYDQSLQYGLNVIIKVFQYYLTFKFRYCT